MSESLSFWPVDCQEGEPDLFVCLSCIDEVFQAKIPVEGCPGCGAIGAFEPFDIADIKDWGTEALILKAGKEPVRVADSDQPVG